MNRLSDRQASNSFVDLTGFTCHDPSVARLASR